LSDQRTCRVCYSAGETKMPAMFPEFGIHAPRAKVFAAISHARWAERVGKKGERCLSGVRSREVSIR